jgi:hypothetical protein
MSLKQTEWLAPGKLGKLIQPVVKEILRKQCKESFLLIAPLMSARAVFV